MVGPTRVFNIFSIDDMTERTWAGHPRGLATLFFTEMWERFSYYGMRAILVLAMVAAVDGSNPGLGLTTEGATAIYGLYTASVYLASLPGGWIADRLIGQRNAVFWGGAIIASGHFCMAANTHVSFYVGLILIALGTGLLKPNVSAMVGELYGPEAGARRDAGYSIFYMGINTGAFVGQLICGYLGEKVGWHWGFGAAGVFMVLGLIQYKLYGTHLGEIGLRPVTTGDAARDATVQHRGWLIVGVFLAGLAAVTAATLTGALTLDAVRLAQGTGIFIVAVAASYFGYVIFFGGLDADEKKRVAVIAVFFVSAAMFWSGFEQAGSSFNLFAQDHTDRVIFGWEAPASWLQSINPMFIILLAPFFAALWVNLGRRGLNPSTPFKFAIGLIQMGIGFLVLYFASLFVVQGEKVAPTWLMLTYLFHTTGELCLSPVGLAAVNKLSPKRYQGQMFGTWFTASALGHLIAGLVAGHLADDANVADMPDRFLFVCMTTAGAGLILLMFVGPIKRLMGDNKP
ncbi:POT family proton-dependent oligopeptide transporter [Panacagrimonas perspica]|uniref:POT family proton-dependent oligopeptide transporter n=2 Tax=Panacagrimonas perspica TaxID=381431 RepID=A0A4R7P4Y2_9GAMM|nr:POT family proton-dependent oligopeptide transporter [Panacagrimonas perspica]